jgi:hypothetical protein
MNQFKPKVSGKQERLGLELAGLKQIEANFDAGEVSSDGGMLLLRKADDRLELSKLAAFCIKDERQGVVLHTTEKMFRQRVHAIAAGYEDCNDAARIGNDPMHLLNQGILPGSTVGLASQPTLSRFENSIDAVTLSALQALLRHTFIRTRKRPPKVLRLYMDTTHDEVHGYQQLSFYNGFYQTYCYTPLFIFADCGFPLCAVLRQGNASPAEGALRALKEIIKDIRLSWSETRIELVADAGFAVPELYEYCEQHSITYFICDGSHAGYAYHTEDTVRNCKALFEEFDGRVIELKKYAIPVNPKEQKRAWRQREERIRFSSKTEGRMQEHFEDDLAIRRYCEFSYLSRGWSRDRRIIARVEYTATGPNVRYIVTNETGSYAKRIYERRYCPRAKCENWIKELKNYLKCDRTSCQEFEANQFRLLLHTFAYVLLWEIRRKAAMQHSTVETIRLQLIKVGVLVQETARKVRLSLASNHPWQKPFRLAWLLL